MSLHTHRKLGRNIKFAETPEVTRLVTAKVIAETVSVSERTIHLWAQSGKIPSKRIGSTVRFDFAEVMAVVNGKEQAQ